MTTVVCEAALRLGYTLKEEQRKIIETFVTGECPQGSGNLCYQCLPYIFDSMRDDSITSVIIVITPLIAIMKDQVLKCNNLL